MINVWDLRIELALGYFLALPYPTLLLDRTSLCGQETKSIMSEIFNNFLLNVPVRLYDRTKFLGESVD